MVLLLQHNLLPVLPPPTLRVSLLSLELEKSNPPDKNIKESAIDFACYTTRLFLHNPSSWLPLLFPPSAMRFVATPPPSLRCPAQRLLRLSTALASPPRRLRCPPWARTRRRPTPRCWIPMAMSSRSPTSPSSRSATLSLRTASTVPPSPVYTMSSVTLPFWQPSFTSSTTMSPPRLCL